ncbi:MAG: ectoine synthase [Nostoc sp. NMS7]|uniref:ectoine synthase n=1 Tax=Nostoc sp. NMS7 TaxID=2815391 RepID=UPI0025E9C3E8|nr:ectoine synthase [Nostoc sp. NMS7]MBN3950373.1 ectoine synthase [Nostoc sp. NMS7]
MLIKHKHELQNTSRAIQTKDWSTIRFLLEEDGVGITVTDVNIHEGSDAVYHYKHHTEVCYCLQGNATLEDLQTGQVHQVRPGTLWVSRKGERFRFVAKVHTRLISIFIPALLGTEVNDEEGSFPLLGGDEKP